MTQDPVILKYWLLIAVYIMTVCVNSVPIIYSLVPWRNTTLGRLFMFQGVSFAVILDLTVIFQLLHIDNVLVVFWTGMFLYASVSISTAALATYIWKLIHPQRKKWVIMTLTGGVYDFLKRAAQIYIPALGTLYFAVAQIWGLPAAEEVVGTTIAVDTFLGVVLGISQKSYNDSEERFGGTLSVHEGEEGSTLRMLNLDANALLTKNEITFKVVHPEPTHDLPQLKAAPPVA